MTTPAAREPLYDVDAAARYPRGAPHLAHPSLRALFAGLARESYSRAKAAAGEPRVLDVGAGQGAATRIFLELGARVTAIDDSESQLRVLRERCGTFGDRLEIRLDDATEAVEQLETYHIVVASSFLHHVRDYAALTEKLLACVAPQGVFLSFQDPLRYDRLGWPTLAFVRAAYLAWRIRQPDVLGGLRRRARRARGVYLETCPEDWIEYHATRGGVDADLLGSLAAARGFETRIFRYFSTQSRAFQTLGEHLRLKNTFATFAVRAPIDGESN